MRSISRFVLRWGLISGLALGGLTMLVGPERVGAGIAQIRAKAQDTIGQMVDDPVAIRRQLEQLAEKYPERMVEVRGELVEVESQLVDIRDEIERDTRVLAFTTEDLGELKSMITRAETAELEKGHRNVFIRFDGIRFDLDEARTEAIRVGSIRTNARDRVGYNQQQQKLLEEQRARLNKIINKLDEDYNTYQTQLYTLDRQIHAIERNERLIEMVEEQQDRLASYDKFAEVGNVRQVQAKLAELQKMQAAQLETLSRSGARNDYEARARYEMEREQDVNAFEDLLEELESVEQEEVAPVSAGKSVAFADPIVIE